VTVLCVPLIRVGAAVISYYTIERPSMAIRRRIERRLDTPSTVTLSTGVDQTNTTSAFSDGRDEAPVAERRTPLGGLLSASPSDS